MLKELSNWILLFLILNLTCTAAFGQTTAQINGTVRDGTGAVLPGAEITATQTATGVTRSTLTDETGSYTLPNLPIGPYRFEASLPGFQTYVQTGIVLQVNSNPIINAVLEVGQVAQTIEVQADAALVETRTTSVSQIMDNQRVLELPLNGRQVTELILLSGLATEGGRATNPGNRNYPTVTITVAGGKANGTSFLLDGANHNDTYNNLNLPMPFPDALQEFKVETSALTAQYGRLSSGVVNAVTKSGTNQFHGSVFEFLRNGSLNARNTFALDNDGLKRNQFGGTIGGPIVQNKLFFFAGNQTTFERSRPSAQRAFIPTPAMAAGDFTTVSSPACNAGRQVRLGAPFVDNRVAPSEISPVALNLINHKLFPKTSDPCGEIFYSRRAKVNEYTTLGRLDYQWTSNHSLFGRYYEARRDKPTDFDGLNILSLSEEDLLQRVYTLVVGDTYLIGANTVNSFRAALSRTRLPKKFPPTFDLSDLGVKGIYTPPGFEDYTYMPITNGFSISSSRPNPGYYNTRSAQLSNDLSMVRGPHQLGFGGQWVSTNLNTSAGLEGHAKFTFNGQVTGSGLGDFMTGRPSEFGQGLPMYSEPRHDYYGLYVQDTWTAHRRLTVNAGVRLEPFIGAHTAYGRKLHFDRGAYDRGETSTVYRNAPPGLRFPGDTDTTNKYSANRWLHFAPRLGLAWDVEGDGRTTVRASGGILFDNEPSWFYAWNSGAPPFGTIIRRPFPGAGSFENPWASYPGGNPFPLDVANVAFPLNSYYSYYPDDLTNPHVSQWNLSFQRQIGSEWMMGASYLGTHAVHLWGSAEDNPALLTPNATRTNVEQRRKMVLENPTKGRWFGQLDRVDDGNTASYHGMALTVQRRVSQGATVQANYTWSHCITDPTTLMPGNQGAGTYPGTRDYLRGECPGDRRHNFNLSTVYQTPAFSNPGLRVLASGWRVSGIVRMVAGNPLIVVSGFDTALTGAAGNNRANQVLKDVYVPNKSIRQWLNPAAFAQPADGTWGNVSTAIYGPGSIRIDMALTREFRVRENQTVEFRAESFNLPNHVNPGDPQLSLRSPQFGQSTTALDPRILQFSLKYVF